MSKKKFLIKWFLVLVITFTFHLSPFTWLCCAATPGTEGAPFLKIGPGARAVGMGEAFVAVADDATALFWNPAGIVQLKQREIAFMHNFWFQGVYYDYFAYVQELPGPGNEKFGLNITYLQYGDMVRTLEDASGIYVGTGSSFSASDLALGLTYAWEMGSNHSLGVNLKFIRSIMDDVSGDAICLDFGYLFRINPVLSVGVNAQNSLVSMPIRFYRGLTAVSSPHTLPINGKVGLAYRLPLILLVFDVNFPLENCVNYHIGMEYKLTDHLCVRAGYKTDLITGLDALSGLCAGLGFSWSGYDVDYAFVPYGDLGQTHRISLSLKF